MPTYVLNEAMKNLIKEYTGNTLSKYAVQLICNCKDTTAFSQFAMALKHLHRYLL